jgi:hypothetical protein
VNALSPSKTPVELARELRDTFRHSNLAALCDHLSRREAAVTWGEMGVVVGKESPAGWASILRGLDFETVHVIVEVMMEGFEFGCPMVNQRGREACRAIASHLGR